MKKSLFFVAAASALMLTACSSESDVVQNTTQQPQATVQQQAVGFDTYLAGTTASTTRAGATGVMTTSTLQTTGFGAFATLSDNGDYASTIGPNFMYNQEVTYANPGWAYTPLKYWPNETTADMYNATGHATATELDKLSFFAYAPYVSSTTGTYGITGMSANNATTDPTVDWTYSTDPDQNVDLLWGVAPAGFSYTNVNGSTTSVPVGMPLKDLVKPDKDQKIKFLFQHALSRISLSVVSAIDQIAAGDDAGTFTSDPTTKVLIKSVTVTGTLGTTGTLNLNNTTTGANIANWTNTPADATFNITPGNYFLAPDLRYDATTISGITAATPTKTFADLNSGVLPSEQTLLSANGDPNKTVTGTPNFAYGKVYYVNAGTGDKGYVIAEATAESANGFTYNSTLDVYTQVQKTGDVVKLNGYSAHRYKITATTATGTSVADTKYYKLTSGTEAGGDAVYTYETTGDDSTPIPADCYTLAVSDLGVATDYASGTYYTGVIPRYFMVIPTGPTDINVNIVYAVVTKDDKLNGTISNVENNITKTVNVDLKNGKSYNLKLILGLTSVKLDATVADWKVDGSTEVDLPQNAE